MISVQLTNKNEIEMMLDGIPKAFAPGIVKKMIWNAVKPVIQEARAGAPVSKRPHRGKYGVVPSGTLRNSLWAIDMKRTKFVTVVVGPRIKGQYGKIKSGFYGLWVDKGHKTRRNEKGQFMTTERKKNFTGFIEGKHFMQKAWDAKKDEVVRIFEADARKVFDREFAKLVRKGKI